MKFKRLVASAIVGALFSGAAWAQVKIGVVSSSTGPVAMVGIPQKNSVPLMPTKVGNLTVQYVPLDDGSDPTASVVAIMALLRDSDVIAVVTHEVADLLLSPPFSADLVLLRLPRPIVIEPYHILRPRDRILSAAAKRLLDLVEQNLAGMTVTNSVNARRQ